MKMEVRREKKMAGEEGKKKKTKKKW